MMEGFDNNFSGVTKTTLTVTNGKSKLEAKKEG